MTWCAQARFVTSGSNTPAWVTAQAQTMALLRGWAPLIALVPWSPLKNGFLSGKYTRGTEVTDSARAAFVGGPTDDEFRVIDTVAAVAADLGARPAAVASAWLRTRRVLHRLSAAAAERGPVPRWPISMKPPQFLHVTR
jgi:aryl-alcohol dehydrogenase-like predicted oxidoreductase